MGMEFYNVAPDCEGIISFKIGDEQVRYHNPFLVALQAMLGQSVFEDYREEHNYLIPRYVPIKWLLEDEMDLDKEKAMQWLMSHYTTDGECAYWEYDYSADYNGRNLSAGWRSAYAQAYVILAMLLFYCRTQDEKFEKMARMAANGLVRDVAHGGCSYHISENELWFEEIPQGECTYIYNAHIVALLALYEIRERLNCNAYDKSIKAGEEAFLRLLSGMNTGTKSAYAYQDKVSSTILLDINSRFDTSIYIGDFTIVNANHSARVDLSKKECFTSSTVYASGVDWATDVTREGLRCMKQGRLVRNVPVIGGDIQNTFINIIDFPIKEDVCKVSFRYLVSSDTEIVLKKNTENGFVPLGEGYPIKLQAGTGEKTIYLPTNSFFDDVSDIYHDYHIELLNNLYARLKTPKIKLLLDDFRSYKTSTRNHRDIEPKLQSLSVIINSECGLHCKMCDIGSENKDASIYNFLKGGDKGTRLDLDLLIQRIKEAPSSLELIHIVGTEPTLHPQLPNLIRKLKDMGKKVLVTTNGINIKRTLIPMLENGVDDVMLSIDGPAEIHNDIRGRDGLFEDIFNFLSAKRKEITEFRKKEQKIVICCAVTPMNYLFIGKLLRGIPNDIVGDVWCTHMNYISGKSAEIHNRCYPEYKIGMSCIHPEMAPTIINPWLMEKSMREARKIAKELNISFVEAPVVRNSYDYEMLYHDEEVSVGRTFCMAPYSTMQINADGSTCVMSRCYNIMSGNIKDKSLEEIFNGAGYSGLRKRLNDIGIYEPCKRCCAIM